MQRQPRTPREAAKLGPSAISPNQPRGIFGRGRRGLMLAPASAMAPGDYPGSEAGGAPPISQAPRPLPDWKNIVGPELLAHIRQNGPNRTAETELQRQPMLEGQQVQPPSRGLIAPNRSPGGSTGKIRNHVAQPLDDSMKSRATPSFFGEGGAGRDIVGNMADFLIQYAGGQPIYRPAKEASQSRLFEAAQGLAQWRRKMAEPDYATVNNRRVRIDPTTGKAEVLYEAPQDFEDYAVSLGAEPGTPEFERLVQDYVLRGSGPTATDNYNTREEWRQDNRLELEGERQGNREALLSQRQAGQRALKGTPTYRQANPLPRPSGRTGGVREGQTATNPQTGAKVVYRGGKWVPAQ